MKQDILCDTIFNGYNKSAEEFMRENNSESCFSYAGCFNACVEDTKRSEWLISTGHTKKLTKVISQIHHQSAKRECAPVEEEVLQKLHLLAGDVETNPGPVVRS